MRYRLWICLALALLVIFGTVLIGCGGDESDSTLVTLRFQQLGRLATGFQYVAWVTTRGQTFLIDEFVPDAFGNATLSQFVLVNDIVTGDRIFVTIESTQAPRPDQPSNTEILSGRVANNIATLVFPRMDEFQNATGFVTASLDGRSILAEFNNLPDVSDLNFVYQGFLVQDSRFTPLKAFNFSQTPVSDSVTFDATTAQYVLTVRPILGSDTTRPFTIQPFFTNGPILPVIRQQLTRSSLTPGTIDFRFPSGTATVK